MEMSETHLSSVQDHTLNQTAEQTRKLTNVEIQVLNQTSRLEIQVLENSLSTNKLEKQLLLQTHEISRLQERNSFLEKKVLAIENQRDEELQGLRTEKMEMQNLLSKQVDLVGHLEQSLGVALLNNTALHKQQTSLAETVKHLIGLVSQCNHVSFTLPEEQKVFKDCAAAYKAGFSTSGVYTLRFPNTTATVKNRYSLRILLQDWENNEAYSAFEHFQVGSEEQNYRLYARRYSGTAGRTSSLSPSGTDFSTKDVDNDRCACKCAQMAGGGWWFDACGPSNLNGIYYPPNPATIRYNGMKWHYWKGPGHSLKESTMMIRPVDFREEQEGML
ncbi:Angiopoietin-2, partial [Ophiophagus hannah]